MNTKLDSYEDIQAAYDEMMSTDSNAMIDPVLMVGYIDNRESNSKDLKLRTLKDVIDCERSMSRLDQIVFLKLIGWMFATIVVASAIQETCEWFATFI